MNASVCNIAPPCSWIPDHVRDDGLWRPSLGVSFAWLAELEITDRAALGVVDVVHQRAVDPHPLGSRIDAEWIGVPQHHIGHLARLEAAGLVEHTYRFR